jgi:hypothetical protein
MMASQLCSLRKSFLALFTTDGEAEKSVVYGRRETAFVEGKNGSFGAALN